MRTVLTFILVLSSVSYCSMYGQPLQEDSSHIHSGGVKPERAILVLGAYSALVTGAHLQNYNSWWKGERGAFHFGEDGVYALGADKLGHFYFTMVGSDVVGHSLVWAGVESATAFFYGGAASLAFQMYVEIEDGFTKALGFSVGDAITDIFGAAYPLLQHQNPVLQNLKFKWNYIRSEEFKRGSFNTVIDDYESQYFWLSANIKELFPGFVPSFFPSFLCVAVGYSVKNLRGSGGGEREFYLALDYDFSKFPGEGAFLSAIKHVLNYFHFPAPTIRFTPSVITYGLRF